MRRNSFGVAHLWLKTRAPECEGITDVPMETGTEHWCSRLFISPHLDDIAFSRYANLVNAPASSKDTLIVTVFDQTCFSFRNDRSYSQEEATKWQRQEDRDFAERSCCQQASLGLSDSSVRYQDRCSHNENSPEDEKQIRDVVRQKLQTIIKPYLGRCPVYVPLALGEHIDHCIVRDAVQEILFPGGMIKHDPRLVLYYEDLPYAQTISDQRIRKRARRVVSSNVAPLLVDVHTIWDEKLAAVRLYSSQLDATTIRTLKAHAEHVGGSAWRKAERVWILKPGSSRHLADTTVWIGWEAARTLGGQNTVMSAILDDVGYTTGVTRTLLLIGPLHLPFCCF